MGIAREGIMILIVTNRQVNVGATDETLFGEEPNQLGLDEIRLAGAAFNEATGQWRVTLVPEPDPLDPANPPSKQLFDTVIDRIKAGQARRHWLFYVHGFNQSFVTTLEVCRQMETKYDVDVLAFSWPSNPGGFVTSEYRRARQAARASSNALDRTLEKLGSYMRERSLEEIQACQISINLLVHSLGCFLLENFVKEPIFSGETRIFENVILHQADVDSRSHYDWIDRIIYGKRLYVTINEFDVVLKVSDMVNPNRLGNTAEALFSKRAVYTDFTGARGVGNAHDIFLGVDDNPVVSEFCRRILMGDRGENVPGFQYNSFINAFRIVD
jgi:esterase/lipase superfamily enzyme